MKKILVFSLLLFSTWWASAQTQSVRAYIVEAFNRLEAKDAFIFNRDTFYATTQLSGIDTTLVSLLYLQQNYIPISQSPEKYEFSVSTDGANNFTIPFTLKPTTMIFLNYALLQNQFWDGENTTTLIINVPLKRYDIFTVNKN